MKVDKMAALSVLKWDWLAALWDWKMVATRGGRLDKIVVELKAAKRVAGLDTQLDRQLAGNLDKPMAGHLADLLGLKMVD